MKKVSLFVAFLMLICVGIASAQQERPGMSGPFAQFREQHKYTFQLMRMVRGLGELEQAKKAPLTKDQAKKILKVMTPLRKQPKLTQDQAKSAMKQIKSVLTSKQLTELGKMNPDRRRFQQADQGNRPRQMRMAGQRPKFDMSKMKDFNPFNASAMKDNQRAARGRKQVDEFYKGLGKKASGK
jgi:hypothetical protein